MGSGSKGPAVMLIRGQAQYRNAYLIAIANKNWIAAVAAVLGMASLLPREANYNIPEPPKELMEAQVLEYHKMREVQKWLYVEEVRVENAISTYVYQFYKKGGENKDL